MGQVGDGRGLLARFVRRRWALLGAVAAALALVACPLAHRPALAPGVAAPPAAAVLQPAVAVPDAAPEIRSPSAILVDAASGDILYAKNPH